jgi:hypothetical protein
MPEECYFLQEYCKLMSAGTGLDGCLPGRGHALKALGAVSACGEQQQLRRAAVPAQGPSPRSTRVHAPTPLAHSHLLPPLPVQAPAAAWVTWCASRWCSPSRRFTGGLA